MLNGKVRPLGSKGSNPLQGHAGVCMYPCVFSRAACPRHDRKTLRHAAGAQARAYLHEEACTVARHPHPLASRAALRLWLFLGCNRISGQTQNDIASPCTAILRLACHRVWLYQEF